jgi:hypothetical protein
MNMTTIIVLYCIENLLPKNKIDWTLLGIILPKKSGYLDNFKRDFYFYIQWKNPLL